MLLLYHKLNCFQHEIIFDMGVWQMSELFARHYLLMNMELEDIDVMNFLESQKDLDFQQIQYCDY